MWMRLSRAQQDTIKQTVAEVFGAEATVRLFGSRLDDRALGGDIDLMIECPAVVDNKALKAARLVARLQLRIGDQPIDVLVLDPATAVNPVYQHAHQTGAIL